MTQTSQKIREKDYLHRFLELIDLVQSYQIVEGNPIPDFLLQFEDTMIGVEVTEIFRQSLQGQKPRQAIENRREKVATIAKEIWESQDLPYVEVSISFGSLVQFSHKTIQGMAEQLVCFVQDHLPEVNSYRIIDEDDFGYWVNYPLLSDMISYISIVRLDTYTRSYWSISDGGFVPKLTIENLQRVIDKKNAIDYRLTNGSIWLLVVADGSRLSSYFDLPRETLEHHYKSQFDQTFLFDTVRGKPYLLQTEKYD